MRFIENPDQLEYPPRACLVTNRVDGDFVDFQKHIETLRGPVRVYMKREIVEQAGELCGMVPRRVAEEEVGELRKQLAAFGAALDQLKEENAELKSHERFVERFAGVSDGEGI